MTELLELASFGWQQDYDFESIKAASEGPTYVVGDPPAKFREGVVVRPVGAGARREACARDVGRWQRHVVLGLL